MILPWYCFKGTVVEEVTVAAATVVSYSSVCTNFNEE